MSFISDPDLKSENNRTDVKPMEENQSKEVDNSLYPSDSSMQKPTSLGKDKCTDENDEWTAEKDTECVLCEKSFETVLALQKHAEISHTAMTKEQIQQSSLMNNPLATGNDNTSVGDYINGRSKKCKKKIDPEINQLKIHQEEAHEDISPIRRKMEEFAELLNQYKQRAWTGGEMVKRGPSSIPATTQSGDSPMSTAASSSVIPFDSKGQEIGYSLTTKHIGATHMQRNQILINKDLGVNLSNRLNLPFSATPVTTSIFIPIYPPLIPQVKCPNTPPHHKTLLPVSPTQELPLDLSKPVKEKRALCRKGYRGGGVISRCDSRIASFKRVYQNTKLSIGNGQLLLYPQFLKNCPFCSTFFKTRWRLERHLWQNHADKLSKGDLNIDTLFDDGRESNPKDFESPSTKKVVLSNLPATALLQKLSAENLADRAKSNNGKEQQNADLFMDKMPDTMPHHLLPVSATKELPTDIKTPLKEKSAATQSVSFLDEGTSKGELMDDVHSKTYSESTNKMDGEESDSTSLSSRDSSSVDKERH